MLFTLDAAAGDVRVAAPLDGHRGRVYTLNVQAEDAGESSRGGVT